MKRVIAVIACLVLLLTLCACGKDEHEIINEAAKNNNTELVGTDWRMTRYGPLSGSDLAEYYMAGSIVFVDETRYQMSMSLSGVYPGTYTFDGKTVTLAADEEEMIVSLTLEGDELIYTLDEHIMVFTRVSAEQPEQQVSGTDGQQSDSAK